MSGSLTIAALQPPLVMLDAAANRNAIEQNVAELVRERPVDLIALPEVFSGWPASREDVDAAESRAFVSSLAKRFRTNVVGGSIGWASGTQRFNVCFLADRTGREAGQYVKRVPFGLEQGRITAGTSHGVFDLDGVRIGVLICGDLWRPELAREMLNRADLLCVPARTGVPAESHVAYARTLWWNLALTRAMENALPVIVADWPAGPHELDGKLHWTSGGSSIVDPSARPDLSRLQYRIEQGGAACIVATIDLEAMERFRGYRRSVGLIP